MVRKRKTSAKGKIADSVFELAIKEVIDGKLSLRAASESYVIPKSTLARAVTKRRKAGDASVTYQPRWDNRRVFSTEHEVMLESYLVEGAKHHACLTKVMMRQFAYEYAKKLNLKYPILWDKNEKAGENWIYSFMKRHPNLSVRTPEATSLSRATSFNRSNVSAFFVNLEAVLLKYKFEANQIYNMDETALTTVHKPPKVIARKNSKPVGLATSAERGTLVTLVGSINAQGSFIPPFLIFPRVNFKNSMLNGTPPGSRGAAHVSGWMNQEIFLQWLEHFAKHAKCSHQHPVLLLMDNHTSHVSISAIESAKEKGIILLTFPPHCSHKLQPLDRTVYGPLKRYYNDSCTRWMLNNPARTISIHEIGALLGESFNRAFTPSNILSGFHVSGVFPYKPDIFGDDMYLASEVTNCPAPENLVTPSTSQDDPIAAPAVNQALPAEPVYSSPSTSQVVATPKDLTPLEVQPFPKAPPRQNQRKRKTAKSLVLTDTPVKERLERERNKQRAKKTSKRVKKVIQDVEVSDSSEDERQEVELNTRLEKEDTSEDDGDNGVVEMDSETNSTEYNTGDYVLVKFTVTGKQKLVKHYV
ncbi:uncharacterized protein [Watersipora subatra]|uniref:uncharacterized protein n=1 Tax=Watersipora subatra TaxID=2589382 RepID=UPI00355B999B